MGYAPCIFTFMYNSELSMVQSVENQIENYEYIGLMCWFMLFFNCDAAAAGVLFMLKSDAEMKF